MKFIDIGANLLDPMFLGIYHDKPAHVADLDSVLNRALVGGVEKVMVTSGTLAESLAAVEMVKKHPSLFTTAGVHPTRCNEIEDPQFGGKDVYFQGLREVVKQNLDKVVAIGECGLDYDRLEFCSRETQLRHLPAHFDLAEETKLPMFLHNRNTGADFAEMVRKNRDKFNHGVSHSFTGTVAEVKELVELGIFIGINGCSLKTEENLEAVRAIPVEWMMIETDAPWCDIRPTHASAKFVKTQFPSVKKEKFKEGLCVKGRNEPCNIVQVLEVVAACKEMSPEELSEVIYENTQKVFFPRE